MDAAASRFIRIGTASIGLVGLDTALCDAARRQLTEQEAADFLFASIKEENYIPPGCAPQYHEALRAAWRRHCGTSSGEEAVLVIRIFGSGCVSCRRLHTLVIEVLDRLEIAADVEQIYDPDEIGRHCVTITPALMIGGKLKSSGILPSPAQVEQWLKDNKSSL